MNFDGYLHDDETQCNYDLVKLVLPFVISPFASSTLAELFFHILGDLAFFNFLHYNIIYNFYNIKGKVVY